MPRIVKARAITLKLDGETVELRRDDEVPSKVPASVVKQLDNAGALVPLDGGNDTPAEIDLATADTAAIGDWIKSEKVKVDTLVERVGEDRELAVKVLEAEGLATGGEPRKTLVDKLEPIAAGE